MLFQSRRDVLTETKYVELILVNDNSQVSISPLQINEIRYMKQILKGRSNEANCWSNITNCWMQPCSPRLIEHCVE
jgi:hypothetical protein